MQQVGVDLRHKQPPSSLYSLASSTEGMMLNQERRERLSGSENSAADPKKSQTEDKGQLQQLQVKVSNVNISHDKKSELNSASGSTGSLTPIEEEEGIEASQRQIGSFEKDGQLLSPSSSRLTPGYSPTDERNACVSAASIRRSGEVESCKSSHGSDTPNAVRRRKSKFHTKLLHLLHHDEDSEHPSPKTEQSSMEFKEKSRRILSPLIGIFVSPKPRKTASGVADDDRSSLDSGEEAQHKDKTSKSNSVSNLAKLSKMGDSKASVDDKSSTRGDSTDLSRIIKSAPRDKEKKSTSSTNGSETSFLDKYVFCSNKIIGKGASGVVRLARKCNSNDKVYAVKEFRKKRRDETYREYIKKLTSEFCIGSMLHHENIVETLDIIKDGDHWYEVMEYCSGGDLYSVIRDGHMGSDEIDCYFRQLVEGVAYLHSVGVAHRDLKPENLLVDDKGHLKITDFGVSEVFRVCWENKPHLSKGLCGSTPYISPEQFLGQDYDAQRVDIWACGIIYYAMTFHGIPWESATLKDPNYKFFTEHRGLQFEPLVRLPHGPRSLLSRMLEPDPSKRISIEDIMADEWFKKINLCCRANVNGRLVVHDHTLIKKHVH